MRETLPCVLFEKAGRDNTEQTVTLAAERAEVLGIDLVVASNTGFTANLLRDRVGDDCRVVCVTHQVGFRSPGEDELPPEVREKLTARGVAVLTTTHLMGGIDRACRFKNQGLYPAEIVAHTLRLLGQGLKVCVECAVMALDAGLIRHDQEVVAVGGTGRGADTACVIQPAHGHDIFALRVREILCKPR